MDPPGAQEKVLEIAASLGLSVRVAVAHEVSVKGLGMAAHFSYGLVTKRKVENYAVSVSIKANYFVYSDSGPSTGKSYIMEGVRIWYFCVCFLLLNLCPYLHYDLIIIFVAVKS